MKKLPVIIQKLPSINNTPFLFCIIALGCSFSIIKKSMLSALDLNLFTSVITFSDGTNCIGKYCENISHIQYLLSIYQYSSNIAIAKNLPISSKSCVYSEDIPAFRYLLTLLVFFQCTLMKNS